jgi:glycosyltransferase involved in cell wall biosynthesis
MAIDAAKPGSLQDLGKTDMTTTADVVESTRPSPASASLDISAALTLKKAQSPMPLFTVVVPTHNRPERLQRALRSIVAQTMQDYEIVVVDDCSREKISKEKVLEQLQSLKSERLEVLRNDPNRGVSGARNRGCISARGEFVVFLDDDDQLRPTALSSLRDAHEAAPQLDFFWGTRSIHEKDAAGQELRVRDDDWSAVRGPLSGSDFLPFAVRTATNSAFTIRRSVFTALQGFDETLKMSEDREFFIRLARNGSPGAPVHDVLIDVDEHFDGSLSRTVGVKIGPKIDLRVLEKHREYVGQRRHREFLRRYLVEIYTGFLRAGDRVSGLRIAGRLVRNGASPWTIARLYMGAAPEFAWLRALTGRR